MEIVCLDLEGVLVPELWIAFAEETGIPELKRTTRDEPDYDKLMKYRLNILKEHGLGLKEIQETIAKIDPIPGAKEFLDKLRELTQVIIISDTFSQFAGPLMKKLGYPTIFCNSLVVADNGEITDFKMRCEKGKFLLDFIYKHETFESLIKQPTNDVHILCKSTVWGSADVYYSTELLKGTCTKILFNDIDARNTFALKFFKYLNYENSGFSIRELLDDLKYLWGEDDDNLSIDVPWKDIFKGLYMGEEGEKYSLEFIFNQEENKNGSN